MGCTSGIGRADETVTERESDSMNTGSKLRQPAVGGLLFAAAVLLGVAAAAASPDREIRARAVPEAGPCSRELSVGEVPTRRDRVSGVVPAQDVPARDPAAEFVDDLGVWASTPWTVVSVSVSRARGNQADDT